MRAIISSAVALVCLGQAALASDYWFYRYAFGPEGCGCNAGHLGAHPAGTDDYDPALDFPFFSQEEGYAAVYHEQGVNGWTGPTDFYRHDLRSGVPIDQSKTWEPVYVWASDFFEPETMIFGMQPHPNLHPSTSRRWFLTLEAVPQGVLNAPAVGTRWMLPSNYDLFLLELPTVRPVDGRDGYRFSVKIAPVGDLTGDDCVDQADLGQLLAAYGVSANGDFTGDGITDQADLGILLSAYGNGCQ
ncbi:MAG TPA: hypothetical protein PKC49_03285 [Phycisphaerae bacterium]|nr:hypothetical protein [Phycisphaerae bacterium]